MGEPVRPDRVDVDSRDISSIGYDPQTKTLEVMKRDGTLRLHFDVPMALHTAFLEAPSKGRFYGIAVGKKFRTEELSTKCSSCKAIGLKGLACLNCGVQL